MAEFSKKRAILIGIDKYDYVNPLSFCGNDACEIGETFRKFLEFQPQNVLEFTYASNVKPRRNDILHQIGAFLKSGIDPDELLVFYFAGHGMKDKDSGKDYLLPADASPHDLKETAISVDHILDKLGETACQNVVIFIDACREEVSGARTVSEGMGDYSKTAVKRPGTVTFFSCDPRERSYEIDQLQHGSFTYCILEAIKSGRYPTIDLMNKYLREQVPLINAKYEKPPQMPFTVSEPLATTELIVFFHEVTDVIQTLLEKLAWLYDSELLDEDSFNIGVTFLKKVENVGPPEGDDLKRMRRITSLAERKLHPAAFKLAWAVIEKGQLKGSAPSALAPPALAPSMPIA